MTAILNFIVKMAPYMALTVPVYLLSRLIFLQVKKKQVSLQREALLFLFTVFCVALASQTIFPESIGELSGFKITQNSIHKTNLIPFKVLFDTYYKVISTGSITYLLINFMGNVILFIPFGLVIPILWKISWRKTLLIGFGISTFIELCQLFLPRGTDVDDILLNTTGVLLGILIYKLIKKLY